MDIIFKELKGNLVIYNDAIDSAIRSLDKTDVPEVKFVVHPITRQIKYESKRKWFYPPKARWYDNGISNTTWLTAVEVAERIKFWFDNFIPHGSKTVSPGAMNNFTNRYFSIVQIYGTPQGFLWCDMMGKSCSDEIIRHTVLFEQDLKELIKMGKANAQKLSQDDNKVSEV